MKAIVALVLLLAFSQELYSQYYYNDLLTAIQANRQYRLLKQNNINEVTAKSYEADGSPTENFYLQQTVSASRKQITTTTESPATGRSVSVSEYANDQIYKTEDSTNNIKRTTIFTYSGGNMVRIHTLTEDKFMDNALTEEHIWTYNGTIPEQMLLVKNGKDTTYVLLKKDEQGHVIEEQWVRKGVPLENYFYYYTDNGFLSDIVRFNEKAKRLLPDFLFEYDAAGKLVQQIQVPEGSDDYLVWKYNYLSNGLRQSEICYDKRRQPVGRIDYQYR